MPKTAKNQKTRRRLLSEPVAGRAVGRVEEEGWRVPTWWVNTIIGLFLLLPAFLLTETFFTVFTDALRQQFWATEEFWFFSLGCMLWMLWFSASLWLFAEPKFMRLYVFGHELTHAVWVWVFGGRVSEFVVSRDGGYIRTDRDNFVISLSPYFYPIYSLALTLAFGIANYFFEVAAYESTILPVTLMQVIFLLLGLTWAFHLSFTVWMIPKGQTDLTRHGTFFSLVIIYAMNILLLSLFLVVASPHITFQGFAEQFLYHAHHASSFVVRWLAPG